MCSCLYLLGSTFRRPSSLLCNPLLCWKKYHSFIHSFKCEVVLEERPKTTPECDVDGSVLPVGNVGKCRGFWWKGDLMATKSVKENISKA